MYKIFKSLAITFFAVNCIILTNIAISILDDTQYIRKTIEANTFHGIDTVAAMDGTDVIIEMKGIVNHDR